RFQSRASGIDTDDEDFDEGLAVTAEVCDFIRHCRTAPHDPGGWSGFLSTRAPGGRGPGVGHDAVAAVTQTFSQRDPAGPGRCARLCTRRIASPGPRVFSPR